MCCCAAYRTSPSLAALANVVTIVADRLQFRSMCGTPWIDASRARCYNLTFALLHRQPTRWRAKVFVFVKVTFAHLSCALSPQCFLDALVAHNSPSLSTSLSPQCLHSLVLATLLALGASAPTIGCFAGRCNEHRLELAGIGSQVARKPPRVTQGKPPARFPDCH